MRILSALIFILLCGYANAQYTYYPVQHRAYWMLDRMEIKSGQMAPYHTSTKPYSRNWYVDLGYITGIDVDTQGITYVNGFDLLKSNVSYVDRANVMYLFTDNFLNEDPAGYSGSIYSKRDYYGLYKYKAAGYTHFSDEFDMVVNPVLYFSAGTEQETGDYLYQNTRGIEIRGSIDNKIGYYTYITENQMKVPLYMRQVADSNDVLLGEGFYKNFGDSAYDFFQARGYITFRATEHVHMQFGQDRNFIGNGYRSMILSDNAKDYLFLKVNTKVWKLNYQNLFAELIDYNGQTGGGRLHPRKYMAMHHLSVNIGKNFNAGLFEAIIFDRQDSMGNNGGFDLNYINPIIFYRSVEQGLDSRDNALVGADFKYNFLNHFSLYGQLMLDEFKLSEIRAKSGWWANKYSTQLGLKYIDVAGVNNLDLQVEYNTARPFIYTHNRISQNYTHYGQALAHPLGANFREYIGIVRFQPKGRLNFELKAISAEYGRDSSDLRYGGELTRDNNNRARDYDNKIGQGANQKYFYGEFMATWMARHNLFFDLRYIHRKVDSNTPQRNITSSMLLGSIRVNIEPRRYDF